LNRAELVRGLRCSSISSGPLDPSEIDATWDVARIDDDVRASQRARASVDQALRQVRYTAWVFQPSVDASNQ